MVRPSEKTPIVDLKYFDDSLNDSQKDAVKFCLESAEVACIHGPPGMSSYDLAYATVDIRM
jgi:DNA polymerase alpha-associated DNA helicase A